ncbi:hypothetical protein [Oceanobacillus polygoni]|uniref:Lipoprotein n=1 Tax=Oceanobacillus polygoni TaxID=1235259 RepID=A0A9X0YVV9_9BACI|nr:hypothetical protein [Oceanobacillus polygoni]MBP2077941.1 hypothetical protein [Oceanobacillus polygoni]
MMKWIPLFILLLLTGCSGSTPAIIEKVDTVPDETEKDPVLIEQQEEEESEDFIEFSLEDEQILISLKMVPILNEYLNGVNNRKQAIYEMHLERISSEVHDIYLLEFSCVQDLCSYLIFHPTNEKLAYLVADIAKFSNFILSPDESKIVLHFSRFHSTDNNLDTIVVVDLANWKLLSLNNETSNDTILNYKWPFIYIEWVDNESITIVTPDIMEPTIELLTEWQQTNDSPTANTVFSIYSE